MNAKLKDKSITSTELFQRAGLPQCIEFSPALWARFKLSRDHLCSARMELAWLVRGVLTGQLAARRLHTAGGLTHVVNYASLDEPDADRTVAIVEEDADTVHVTLPEEVIHSLPRLLIVDDNADLCEMAGQFLTTSGFSCALAHDGLEGWEQIQKTKPGVVLLDVDMPRLNGLGLLRQIRQDSTHARLPVLMWSGNPSHEAQARKLGADDFISKPCQFSDLIARLKKLLGHH